MAKRKYTDNQLIDAVKTSTSYRQILTQLGLKEAGGNYKTIKHHIKMLQLDISGLTGQGWLRGKKNPYTKYSKTLNEILVDGSYYQTYKLKNRLLKENLLEKKCYIEGCTVETEWNGKPINLRLDHVNGKNDDNRIENLRLVCPNCDSQSETYCGKNKRVVK